jgi:hypothetical protein
VREGEGARGTTPNADSAARRAAASYHRKMARMIWAPASQLRKRGLDMSCTTPHIILPTTSLDSRPGQGKGSTRSTSSAVARDRSQLQ